MRVPDSVGELEKILLNLEQAVLTKRRIQANGADLSEHTTDKVHIINAFTTRY